MTPAELAHRFSALAYSLREDPTGTGERWSACNVCGCEAEEAHDPACPVDAAERADARLNALVGARDADGATYMRALAASSARVVETEQQRDVAMGRLAALAGAGRAYAGACDDVSAASLAVDMLDDVPLDNAESAAEFSLAVERHRKARRARKAARAALDALLAETP